MLRRFIAVGEGGGETSRIMATVVVMLVIVMVGDGGSMGGDDFGVRGHGFTQADGGEQ